MSTDRIRERVVREVALAMLREMGFPLLAERIVDLERVAEAARGMNDFLCQKLGIPEYGIVPDDWRERSCGECSPDRLRLALAALDNEDSIERT